MRLTTVTADDGVRLNVATCGSGPDVVILSGGPGCVHYLADKSLAPDGFRCWFPDPRGVGNSGGGPHDMARAISDVEVVRRAIGIDEWIVIGHSWGSDLAVRYAVDHPRHVRGVIGIAGHGLHRDRDWTAAYEAGKSREPEVEIDWVPPVHAALLESFADWVHQPTLWREVADCTVPMSFVIAGNDIRPSWPILQLAELIPHASSHVVPAMPHNFWASDPELWRVTCTTGCRRFS